MRVWPCHGRLPVPAVAATPWVLGLMATLSLAAGPLAACRDRPSPQKVAGRSPESAEGLARGEVRVVSVRVLDRTSSSDQVRFRPDDLRALVIGQLREHPGFAVALGPGPKGPRDHLLKVDLELQGLVGKEKAKASAIVSLELVRLQAEPDEPGYLGSALQEKVYKLDEVGSLRDLYRTLLERAVSEVIRGISLEIRLRTAPPAIVVHAIQASRLDTLDEGWSGHLDVWLPIAVPGQLSLLGDVGLPGLAAALLLGWTAPTAAGSDGTDVRELAIKIAALRRLREAVPVLLTTLEQERRERVRDLCLGALAEIRDEKAVPALTRYSKFGDTERLRKVIGVLGQIGGKEARAFLEMTADSHEDEDLQKLARETLERLTRSAQPPRAGRP